MIVFSSPEAAKRWPPVPPLVASGLDRLSHTAWCRWICSIGGTLPSARTRFGLKLVMYPS